MKAAALLNSRAGAYAALALVVAVIGYVVVKRLGEAADKSLDEFNEGTPYGGFSDSHGAVLSGVAAAGNTANQLSGGVLAEFGGWLGRTFYDLTADDYDPNAPAPYAPRKATVRGAQ